MGIKFISLVTGLVTLDVYLQSQLFSNGPLFLLISNNIIVNSLMVALAAGAIFVSFRNGFKNWYFYAACTLAAILLTAIGFAGVFFGTLVYSFWYVSSPLDFLFLLQFGIIFSLCCLSYNHAKRPKNVRLPQLVPLGARFKTALPVPKISHPPMRLSANGSPAQVK